METNEEVKINRMADVEYSEDVLNNLNNKPLLRDNLENIKKDFNSIYEAVINQDMGELPVEALVKIKGDLFTAFCHGTQMATRTESSFRKGFRNPKEFGGSGIITNDDLVVPKKKLDLIL